MNHTMDATCGWGNKNINSALIGNTVKVGLSIMKSEEKCAREEQNKTKFYYYKRKIILPYIHRKGKNTCPREKGGKLIKIPQGI